MNLFKTGSVNTKPTTRNKKLARKGKITFQIITASD